MRERYATQSDCRTVLRKLKYIIGHEYKQIAKELGLTPAFLYRVREGLVSNKKETILTLYKQLDIYCYEHLDMSFWEVFELQI